MITLDDRILNVDPFSDVCSRCKHWAGTIANPRLCKAFGRNTIPSEIWDGRNPHKTPYPGDNGVLFEQVTEADLLNGSS